MYCEPLSYGLWSIDFIVDTNLFFLVFNYSFMFQNYYFLCFSNRDEINLSFLRDFWEIQVSCENNEKNLSTKTNSFRNGVNSCKKLVKTKYSPSLVQRPYLITWTPPFNDTARTYLRSHVPRATTALRTWWDSCGEIIETWSPVSFVLLQQSYYTIFTWRVRVKDGEEQRYVFGCQCQWGCIPVSLLQVWEIVVIVACYFRQK